MIESFIKIKPILPVNVFIKRHGNRKKDSLFLRTVPQLTVLLMLWEIHTMWHIYWCKETDACDTQSASFSINDLTISIYKLWGRQNN